MLELAVGLGSQAVAARASRYSCHATWPGHLFNWRVLVGPQGSVVDVHWKLVNNSLGQGGEVLTGADKWEARRRAVINMKEFRAKHRLPDVHLPIYQHVFDRYRVRYDAGLYGKALPETKLEAFQQFQKAARWTHYW